MKNARLAFLLILWGTITAVFMYFMYAQAMQVLVRQYHAQSFAKTEGTILAAEVTTHRGSKGHVFYHPAFAYSYRVNGHSYQAYRYRYDGQPSDSAAVYQIVGDHPAGSTVVVYYDPENPTETVLSPLVVAHDLALLFFGWPLVMFFLFHIFKIMQEANWLGGAGREAGGVKIISDMMTIRVRLPRYTPGFLGAATACGLAVVAGIILQQVSAPPIPACLFALTVLLLAGGAVYLWQYRKVTAGLQDLVIHQGAHTVELPLTYKRRVREVVPISGIKAVTLVKVKHVHRSSVSYTYAPTLRLRDGSSERLTDFNKSRAESLVAWLQAKLGLPAETSARPD